MNNGEGIRVERARRCKRWAAVDKLPGGGRGVAFRAHRKTDGREAFAKAIVAKTDAERRASSSREANAHVTIRVGGVPRLVEGNSHRYKDAEIEPRVANDFSGGSTLLNRLEKPAHSGR